MAHDPSLDYIFDNIGIDYLKQRLENANGEICILLDNIQQLKGREDLFQRMKDVQFKINWLVGHFDIPEED